MSPSKLLRLDEGAEIVVFDRGPYVSFAKCGLPYYVGNVIAEEGKLLVISNQRFRERFRIDVRTEHEALRIDRQAKVLAISVRPESALAQDAHQTRAVRCTETASQRVLAVHHELASPRGPRPQVRARALVAL